jgi:plasmid stabilization system protein ParE
VNVRFLTLAKKEIDDAVVWFDEQQEGKGAEFLAALSRALRLVKAYPYASPEVEPEVRRCLFVSFPYSLIYGIDDEAIIVLAVAHTHREPRYWVDRLG